MSATNSAPMNRIANILKGHFTNRIIVSYWLIIIAWILGFSIYSGQMIKGTTFRTLSQQLSTQADLVGRMIPAEWVKTKNRAEINPLVHRLTENMQNRITVIADDGEVLGDSDRDWPELLNMVNHRTRPEISAAFETGFGQSVRYSTTLRIDMLYVAKPLRDDTGTIGFVRVALPLTAVRTAVRTNLHTILWAGIIGLVLALLFGIGIARLLTRPIRAITRAVNDLAAGKSDVKIPVYGPDELSQLASTINRLNGQLTVTIRELANEKSKLSTIIEGMTEAVIALDEKNIVEFYNPAAQRILDFPDATTGRNLLEVSRIYELANLIDETRLAEEPLQREIELIGLEPKHFQASATLLANQGIIIVLSDISRLKQLEKIRREFVANVSHELRTPLTLIQGNIETLKGEKNPKAIERSLATIERHSERLNRLLTDLLDLSSIEQDEAKFSFRKVDLKTIIKRSVANFTKQAQAKHQTLKVQTEPELSSVSADPDRLDQVLSNLLDNAIKFTPDGGKIVVRALPQNTYVRVEVIDNGPGIPEEDQPRIFERFYRVDKARSRELGGTGLGLAIVKHIIEAHNGKVWVESVLDRGSKFCFTLPTV